MSEQISFDEFKRIDVRIARIASVQAHPNAEKLYIIKLDVGPEGERQTCAGLKPYYRPEELVGKLVAVILNLAPAKVRGEISETMMLAGQEGPVVAVLSPEKPLAPGSKVY